MPLDPKQQPPYYTPNTNVNTAITTPLSNVTAIEESIGTSATSVATYTLPANSMKQTGDLITLNYWGNTYNNPTTWDIYLDAFGIYKLITSFAGETGNAAYHINVQILRSGTTIYYTTTVQINGQPNRTNSLSAGPIDFTIPQLIEFQIQAGIDGNIRLTSGYTQLIKTN